MADPARVEYPARRARWAAAHESLEQQDRRLAFARLAVFGTGVLALVLAVRGSIPLWSPVVAIGAFVPLLKRHERVIQARRAAANLVTFYEHGLARLQDRWVGTGATGERFLDEEHLYAADLDLFGRGSLFELLSLARTRTGEETLADWLKHPRAAAAITARHQAVEELREALDLREALTLAGAEIRAGVHPDELEAWASAPSGGKDATWEYIAVALTMAMTLLVLASWLAGSLIYLIAAAILRAVYQQIDGDRVEKLLQQADTASRDLRVLRPALERLEHEVFGSAPLQSLQAEIRGSQVPASAAIRALRRYVEMHDWQHNMVFVTDRRVADVEHAPGLGDRGVARAARRVTSARWLDAASASSRRCRRSRPTRSSIRTIRFRSCRRRRRGGGRDIRRRGARAPAAAGRAMVRNDVAPRRRDAAARRQRLEHVGQEHAAAHRRHQRGAGAGRRAGARRVAPPVAAGASAPRCGSRTRCRRADRASTRRSRASAQHRRPRARASAAAVPARRAVSRHQLARSADRAPSGVLRSLLDRGAIGLITTHDLALTAIAERSRRRAPSTSTSRTGSRAARCASTTA